MNLPEFPNSREVTLDDKPLFDELFRKDPPVISAYTFTNIFAWRKPYNTTISQLNGAVLIQHNVDNKTIFLKPIGASDPKRVVEQVLEINDVPDAEFERIPKGLAEQFIGNERFNVKEMRKDFDYVYFAQDLIELTGRNYDAKRNFIKRFRSKYNHEYVMLDSDGARECKGFTDYWCEDKNCTEIKGMAREYVAVHEMLDHFDELGIIGGALKVEGCIVAFSLGEQLNPDTLVVHVEKGDSRYEGSYQAINNEFCKHAARDLKYVNREQDLGVPGLRKAKESYHPVKLVKTYSISLA